MNAIEFLVEGINKLTGLNIAMDEPIIEQAKEMEKTNIDNKVIHFSEWLTKRHTVELMTLYDYFEEQYYKEKGL